MDPEFVAEFLMPEKQLSGTSHGHWHVSEAQFATRANSSARGPLARRETSKLLTKVFKVLRENGTTPLHVAKELNLGLEELNVLVFGLVLAALPVGCQNSALAS